MENMETDWTRYNGPFRWFHCMINGLIYSRNHSNATVITTANTWLKWNARRKKTRPLIHLEASTSASAVVFKSKFWKHVWIYTVWSSISFTEPPFPLRSQLRRKAHNPAISLAPGNSASNGKDRCCEIEFFPLRVPNTCLIPKLWNIWNEVKQLYNIDTI
jgi:hypothetical protein